MLPLRLVHAVDPPLAYGATVEMDSVVDDALLSHIYGTPIEVAHTPLGDLYMRSVL